MHELRKTILLEIHDEALRLWYEDTPKEVTAGVELRSLVLAQHFTNFVLWELEDNARRIDVEDVVIAEVKRSIDIWNQRRNDLVETLDNYILNVFQTVDTENAELHSETAGMMIDRLSILSLKIWHMAGSQEEAQGREESELAEECAAKLAALEKQRSDLGDCLEKLLRQFEAGERFFKRYRQFKAYNDPRLNPFLRED